MDMFMIVYKTPDGMGIYLIHADCFSMAEAEFNNTVKNEVLPFKSSKKYEIYQITKLSND